MVNLLSSLKKNMDFYIIHESEELSNTTICIKKRFLYVTKAVYWNSSFKVLSERLYHIRVLVSKTKQTKKKQKNKTETKHKAVMMTSLLKHAIYLSKTYLLLFGSMKWYVRR